MSHTRSSLRQVIAIGALLLVSYGTLRAAAAEPARGPSAARRAAPTVPRLHTPRPVSVRLQEELVAPLETTVTFAPGTDLFRDEALPSRPVYRGVVKRPFTVVRGEKTVTLSGEVGFDRHGFCQYATRLEHAVTLDSILGALPLMAGRPVEFFTDGTVRGGHLDQERVLQAGSRRLTLPRGSRVDLVDPADGGPRQLFQAQIAGRYRLEIGGEVFDLPAGSYVGFDPQREIDFFFAPRSPTNFHLTVGGNRFEFAKSEGLDFEHNRIAAGLLARDTWALVHGSRMKLRQGSHVHFLPDGRISQAQLAEDAAVRVAGVEYPVMAQRPGSGSFISLRLDEQGRVALLQLQRDTAVDLLGTRVKLKGGEAVAFADNGALRLLTLAEPARVQVTARGVSETIVIRAGEQVFFDKNGSGQLRRCRLEQPARFGKRSFPAGWLLVFTEDGEVR